MIQRLPAVPMDQRGDVKAIIGIDPGTHCGACVLDANTGMCVMAEGASFSTSNWEGGGMRFVKARAFFNRVIKVGREYAGDEKLLLAYEEVRGHKGTIAAHIYGAMMGLITTLCEDLGIPYGAVNTGTVKKIATGKGNAPKGPVLASAIGTWPEASIELLRTRAQRENVADALWVAEAYRRNLFGL